MFNFAFTKLILPTTLHPKKSIYTNNEQLRLQSLRMAAASGTSGPTGCHRLGKRRSMARLQQNHRNPLSKHQSMQQRVLPHKIRHQRRSFPAARHSRAIAISFHHVLREFTRLFLILYDRYDKITVCHFYSLSVENDQNLSTCSHVNHSFAKKSLL